jgi:hypothetical protein
LAQLLRADLLPEAWIAPPAVGQLRAPLRHRVKLVRLRTLLRNRIHAVLAHHGQDRPAGCWSGQAIAKRRGRKITTTAIARKLLTCGLP